MEWAEGIQNAINYIEDHICDELDIENIAAQAACSPYYFQKIFGIMCGMTVGEYIRSRKLTLAGSDLTSSDIKVIDLALKYGYESPESFTRTFTKFHGLTPTDARKGGELRSFSRLKVQVIIKGGNELNYKTVEKPAFTVLEKVERHTVSNKGSINTIPEFWGRAHRDGTVQTLLSNASDHSYIFGISYGAGHTDNECFDYAIAVECAPDTIPPEGFRVNTIPASTWVVSECTGPMPEAIQKLWHDMCSEFFPTSNFKPTLEMDIEAFPVGNMTFASYKSQIWIPIVKK